MRACRSTSLVLILLAGCWFEDADCEDEDDHVWCPVDGICLEEHLTTCPAEVTSEAMCLSFNELEAEEDDDDEGWKWAWVDDGCQAVLAS